MQVWINSISDELPTAITARQLYGNNYVYPLSPPFHCFEFHQELLYEDKRTCRRDANVTITRTPQTVNTRDRPRE
jgi:hypothetical protein